MPTMSRAQVIRVNDFSVAEAMLRFKEISDTSSNAVRIKPELLEKFFIASMRHKNIRIPEPQDFNRGIFKLRGKFQDCGAKAAGQGIAFNCHHGAVAGEKVFIETLVKRLDEARIHQSGPDAFLFKGDACRLGINKCVSGAHHGARRAFPHDFRPIKGKLAAKAAYIAVGTASTGIAYENGPIAAKEGGVHHGLEFGCAAGRHDDRVGDRAQE